jgi:ferredoxin
VGWCYVCEDICITESLTDAWLQQEEQDAKEGLDRAQERIDNIMKNPIKRLFMKDALGLARRNSDFYLAKALPLLAAQNDLLKSRRSDPRCQQCGCDHTSPIEFDEHDGLARNFQHICGGMLKLCPDECDISFSLRPTIRLLTTEGEFIRELDVEQEQAEEKALQETGRIIMELAAKRDGPATK